MEFISKIVECNGNPTEIIMNKMMKPCSQEELDAMSAQEREGCKYMSHLNTREYVAEEGIMRMQDVTESPSTWISTNRKRPADIPC